MIKVSLFIDNSNFYHSLKDSRRLPFPPSDYAKLFAKLSAQFNFDFKEIILYDAVKDVSKEAAQYVSQQKFHSGIRNLVSKWPIQIKTRKLKYLNGLPEEKGVDVLLAVDVIRSALSKTIETIIILSGDADFVPAVDFVKSLGIKTINLHPYSGSSTELREACDKNILIDFSNSDIVLIENKHKN